MEVASKAERGIVELLLDNDERERERESETRSLGTEDSTRVDSNHLAVL